MNRNFFISALIGLVTGAANGLFGAGGGTILVPSVERFLKIKPHKAHATAIAVILPLSIVSACFYIIKGRLLTNYILWTSLGGILGGFMGAKLLGGISGKWLHRIFGIFMIVAAVRMIL